MYSVEPSEGWQVGDRAYCILTVRLPNGETLERGRIYQVTTVKTYSNLVCSCLKLDGVNIPDESDGVRSGRFINVSRGRPMARLSELSRASRLTAYYASTGRDENGLPAKDTPDDR